MTYVRLSGVGITAVSVFIAVGTPALAQFDINLNSQLLNQRQLLSPINNQRLRALQVAPQRRRGAVLGLSRAGGAAPTVYRRDPAISARVRSQYVAFVRQVGGVEEAAHVQSDFGKFDPVQVWTKMVRDNGLAPNDMSDALAAYMSLNWAMANGRDVNAPQARALRAELRAMMASNPEFARMSEADRQEFSEALMCNYLYQEAAYAHAIQSGDRVFASKLGDAAEARFRSEMDLSLRAIQLTSRGIERRG